MDCNVIRGRSQNINEFFAINWVATNRRGPLLLFLVLLLLFVDDDDEEEEEDSRSYR